MKLYVHLESSRFKAKNAARFKKEMEERCFNLEHVATKDGFVLYGTGAYCVHAGYEFGDEDSIAYFVQEHIRTGEIAELKFLFYNEDRTDLAFDYYVVSEHAVNRTKSEQLLKSMRDGILPRTMKATSGCHNKENKTWIEKGKKYLVTGEDTHRNRKSWVVTHEDGREITWGKEYFE